MATAGKGIPPARRNSAGDHPLTIMVMGKVGKVRSFRLSRRLFVLALLFFAAYLPISAYLVNRYFDLSRANETQQVRIERLEQDLTLSANALSRSKEHILFLKDYISQMEKGEERASPPPRPRAKKAEGAAPPRPVQRLRKIKRRSSPLKIWSWRKTPTVSPSISRSSNFSRATTTSAVMCIWQPKAKEALSARVDLSADQVGRRFPRGFPEGANVSHPKIQAHGRKAPLGRRRGYPDRP
jgi:hypothetical protein